MDFTAYIHAMGIFQNCINFILSLSYNITFLLNSFLLKAIDVRSKKVCLRRHFKDYIRRNANLSFRRVSLSPDPNLKDLWRRSDIFTRPEDDDACLTLQKDQKREKSKSLSGVLGGRTAICCCCMTISNFRFLSRRIATVAVDEPNCGILMGRAITRRR